MALKTWKFVDQTIASPAVLLDMNSSANDIIIDGDEQFSMPSPPETQSWAENALRDGSILAGTSYENRELTFGLGITGTETQKADRLNRIIAELSKERNILQYRVSPEAEPIYFRTFRSAEFDVIKDSAGSKKEFWKMKCRITAEPYALGVRQDLNTVTVTNDPAAVGAGVNPIFWDITGIKGNAPTPALVRMTAIGNGLFSWRTKDNPGALTLHAQAESATLGTDTTTFADASLSGGNGTRTTFATNNLTTFRLTFTLPTATSAEALRGRYRVLVRTRAAVSTDTFIMRFLLNSNGDGSYGPRTTHAPGHTNWEIVDLGMMANPAFPAPMEIGYSGLPPGLSPMEITLLAQRTSGAGNLEIDYVYMMPASEGMCDLSQVGGNPWIVLDGPQNMVYGMGTGSTILGPTVADRMIDNGARLTPHFGELPFLVPGVTNRWYFLRMDNAPINNTEDITTRYWPLFLEVAS